MWFAFVLAQLTYPLRQTFPEFYENARYSKLLEEWRIDPASTAELNVPQFFY